MTGPDAATLPDFSDSNPRDFSSRRRVAPISFTTDGPGTRIYHAPARLHPAAFAEIGEVYNNLADLDLDNLKPENVGPVVEAFVNIIKAIVRGEDGQHLAERMTGNAEPPLDLVEQAIPIVNWLLEEYGYRPTPPSSPLPAGMTEGTTEGPTDDTSSMAGASHAESTTTG